jgi:pimeloyl-ACP methyl ester carboxylesterase
VTDAICPTIASVKSCDGTTIAYYVVGSGGPGVIVVGGALSRGRDYLPLAAALARTCTAYVVDRRGRGHSGPQGPEYNIQREVEDLLAVEAATGSRVVFGHSYGGLVALEAARQRDVFTAVACYEPGVSIGGSIKTSWMPRYRQLLIAGDRRGAFAAMVKDGGHTPLGKLPDWYVRLILRAVVRGRRWQNMEPLLESNLAEHEQVAGVDDGTAERYRQITARVLLLGGSKSPSFMTTSLFAALQDVIRDCTAEVINGLDHFAPDQKAPELIADRVRDLCPRDDARAGFQE